MPEHLGKTTPGGMVTPADPMPVVTNGGREYFGPNRIRQPDLKNHEEKIRLCNPCIQEPALRSLGDAQHCTFDDHSFLSLRADIDEVNQSIAELGFKHVNMNNELTRLIKNIQMTVHNQGSYKHPPCQTIPERPPEKDTRDVESPRQIQMIGPLENLRELAVNFPHHTCRQDKKVYIKRAMKELQLSPAKIFCFTCGLPFFTMLILAGICGAAIYLTRVVDVSDTAVLRDTRGHVLSTALLTTKIHLSMLQTIAGEPWDSSKQKSLKGISELVFGVWLDGKSHHVIFRIAEVHALVENDLPMLQFVSGSGAIVKIYTRGDVLYCPKVNECVTIPITRRLEQGTTYEASEADFFAFQAGAQLLSEDQVKSVSSGSWFTTYGLGLACMICSCCVFCCGVKLASPSMRETGCSTFWETLLFSQCHWDVVNCCDCLCGCLGKYLSQQIRLNR